MIASTALVALLPANVQSGQPWSPAALLGACSGGGSPEVLFPRDTPRHPTGPGAIVWSAAPNCPGGPGPRISAITPGADRPGPAAAAHTAAGRSLGLAAASAAAAPHGRILLAGPAAAGAPRTLELSEGLAGGAFGDPRSSGGASEPLALATAYLGDVALAAPGRPRGGEAIGGLELLVHRYYARGFLAPVPIDAGHTAAVEGLTVAIDYRSDALAVWERSGTIYARDMPGSGRSSQPVRRVAAAAPGAHIAALLSDDNRAILAWSETRHGVTSVYAELTAAGVSFVRPQLLERFQGPYATAPPSGAPRLVRLSSESVMLAWTGLAAGHWAVHTAAVDLGGVRSIATISTPGHDALLADLAPGPHGEAFALWSEPQPTAGGPDLDHQALLAARGVDARPGRTLFTAPELIAPAGRTATTGQAAIGLDPDSDRAIAAWRTPEGAIAYSLRALGG